MTEFSRNELRESHATIHELTSQIQGLQERMNEMNDSKECQDIESTCSGKLSHVPSQPAVVPATKACDLPPGICLGHRETFLAVHEQESIHHRYLIKEFFTL